MAIGRRIKVEGEVLMNRIWNMPFPQGRNQSVKKVSLRPARISKGATRMEWEVKRFRDSELLVGSLPTRLAFLTYGQKPGIYNFIVTQKIQH